MKICIFGAGAVGGFLAVRLAQIGEDVSIIARGAHLDAIQHNGLTLLVKDERINVRLNATNDPREAGPQDLVVVTVKEPSLCEIVDGIKYLTKQDTPILFVMNGIPWWYFYGLDLPGKERQIDILDPGNRWWNEITPEKALGGVIYSANMVVEPGVIRNNSPDRNLLMIGEPCGAISKRCQNINSMAEALAAKGLLLSVVDDIRYRIWNKLLGNISFAPVCTLTSSTITDVILDKDLRTLVARIMEEAVRIADAIGIRMDIDIEERIAGNMKLVNHKPSMLQDFELRRPLEIRSILLTPQKFGLMGGVATPNLDAIISLVRHKIKMAWGKKSRPGGSP